MHFFLGWRSYLPEWPRLYPQGQLLIQWLETYDKDVDHILWAFQSPALYQTNSLFDAAVVTMENAIWISCHSTISYTGVSKSLGLDSKWVCRPHKRYNTFEWTRVRFKMAVWVLHWRTLVSYTNTLLGSYLMSQIPCLSHDIIGPFKQLVLFFILFYFNGESSLQSQKTISWWDENCDVM